MTSATTPMLNLEAADSLLARLDSLEANRTHFDLPGLIELAEETVAVTRNLAGAITVEHIAQSSYSGVRPMIESATRLQMLIHGQHTGNPPHPELLTLEIIAARSPIIEAREIVLGSRSAT